MIDTKAKAETIKPADCGLELKRECLGRDAAAPLTVKRLGDGVITFATVQHGKAALLLICPHETAHPPDLDTIEQQIKATKCDEEDFSFVLNASGGDAFLYFTSAEKAATFQSALANVVRTLIEAQTL